MVCLFYDLSKRLIGITHSFKYWQEESCRRGCGVGGLLVGLGDILMWGEDCCIFTMSGQSEDC